MGVKTNNLNRIKELGINVHEYKEISTLEDLIEYSKYNDKFSIRFDSLDGRHNLPFYTYDKDINSNQVFDEIIDKMNNLNCTLLVSNGYKYDQNIKFNYFLNIKENNDFILELCSKKIPLRDMYDGTITTIIKDNLFDNYSNYIIENKDSNQYIRKDIEKILDIIINHINIKYMEGTVYDINVGIYDEDIAVWQIN